MTTTTPEEQLSAIAASPGDPSIGAFFDLDGTLVSGFTATVHAGHRIRQRQANVGEVLGVIEASLRYRLGRMEFEPLVVRAAGYLRGGSSPTSTTSASTCSAGTSRPGCSPRCAPWSRPTRSAGTPWR